MEKEKFNQFKYQNEWLKKNYTRVGVSCRSEFVEEFGVRPAEIGGAYNIYINKAFNKLNKPYNTKIKPIINKIVFIVYFK